MRLADKLKPPVEWKPQPEILLCPRVPKPMHGLAPRVVLGKEWWDAERKAAYRSTNYHCLACGVSKFQAKEHQWLEGHETYEIDYGKGLCRYVKTVPLCHYCHNYIHIGRLLIIRKGQLSDPKIQAVLLHGIEVLKRTNEVRPEPYNGVAAPWSKWRLVIGRRRFKSSYATFADWCKAYGRDPKDAANDWFNFQ